MAKKMINGLPVFEARMTSENCGVLRVSLVDDPAVEADFVAYDKQERKALYKITDEDKKRIFGCVLRADYPIYRRDDENGEYYIIFRADEIRAFAQKYLAEGRQNEVDLEHDYKSIDGAEMVQYFIKDTDGGVAPSGFDEVADGSLFAEYQITDDDLWERIKDGEFHGFSVEIVHAVLPAEFSSNKKNMRKSVLAKVKDALAQIVAECDAELTEEPAKEYKAITTKNGTLFWDGDEDLKAGDAVHGEDEDGNRTEIADGEYPTEDNRIIVVAEGKVSEIKDAEPEEEPKKEDETPAEDAEAKEKKDAFAAKCQEYAASYDEKRRKIYDAIKEKLGALVYFYIYDCGDDFATIETYDEDYNSHYSRFAIVWNGEEAAVEGEAVEGHIGFIPNEEPKAPAAEQEQEQEQEMARVKADYEAQIAEKDAKIADLEAKLAEPAGKPAHDAFRAASKKELYSAENAFEMAKQYLK